MESETSSPAESQPKAGKRKSLTSVQQKQRKKRKLEVTANPLDATWIHPESYELADKVLEVAELDKQLIGQMTFTEQLKIFANSVDVTSLADSLHVTNSMLKQILDGLMQPVTYDVRDHYRQPLFRSGILSLSDTRVGQHLTGSVTNVTHFGAFVDVGVGHDALIHTSAISARLLPPSRPSLLIGDHVVVCVKSVDVSRHRLSVSLVQLLFS